MMKYAREHGATTYDFGGTDNDPDKDSEHYGLWAFKKCGEHTLVKRLVNLIMY